MSIDREVPVDGTQAEAAATPTGGSRSLPWKLILPAVIVLDIVAFFAIPPYPKHAPGTSISGIGDLINANIELPAPQTVIDFAKDSPPAAGAIVFVHPSISNTLITSWIVMAVVLALVFLATRGLRLLPGRVQNVALPKSR